MTRALKLIFLVVLVSFSLLPLAAAAADTQLTREEVTVIKRKLTVVAAAPGQPPARYVKEDESFSLPTGISRVGKSEAFQSWAKEIATAKVLWQLDTNQ